MSTAAPTHELNATGFVLLAQIAREPISPYQLTQLMRRNIHYLWPRAESRIYAEVQRLEAAGFVAAGHAAVGRRTRSILRITATGRAALRRWLARPVQGGIALHSEALLRVFFATLGSVDDLRRALEQVRDDANELLGVAQSVGAQYLAGAGSAPEQAHVRAMIHELLGGYATWLATWSTQNLHTLDGWSDLAADDKRRAALERFAQTQRRLGSATSAIATPHVAAPRATRRRRA
jgi:PadR family transcriptional regulator, regulatory protein AphA